MTTTPDVERLQIEDELRYWNLKELEYQMRLEYLTRHLDEINAKNGENMTALRVFNQTKWPEAMAEMVDSDEPISKNPPAKWRSYHTKASAICDDLAALEAAYVQSTVELTECGHEIDHIEHFDLPRVRGNITARKDRQVRIDQEQAQAVAAYKARAKETQSTLTLIKQRLGIP